MQEASSLGKFHRGYSLFGNLYSITSSARTKNASGDRQADPLGISPT
jgi:hypothetical protein